ncbi:MAG: barstar family protein [Spirosomaceae bacterium]|nr:barstar family protein [Spirosomataceae bacterium]
MAHLQLVSDLVPWEKYEIINLDGEKCQTLRGFYEAIAEAMSFPEDFGFNIDSLDDMLSNLSWMEEEKIAVYTLNSEHFLSKERNESKKLTLLDRLSAICEDWRWMEPDENEDDFEKKQLVFLFHESENIQELLKNVEG